MTRTLRRGFWLTAGGVSLVLGLVGVVVPLLPTTPFVLLAAACFSRGSERWEHWLLSHRVFGPMVRDWRAHGAIPLRAKQLATVMMTIGSVFAAMRLPMLSWLPALCCTAVAVWMWRQPSRAPMPELATIAATDGTDDGMAARAAATHSLNSGSDRSSG